MNITQLKNEFEGKTNHEAYDLAFTKRMLRPDPNQPGAYLGNNQRQEFMPFLQKLFRQLPQNAEIFDVGAGGGEMLDTAFRDVNRATINIVEPNQVLIAKYRERLKHFPNLKEGTTYCGLLQDFYTAASGHPPAPSQPQDLVLAIHMLYHLTDPRAEKVDPDADIERAITTLFPFLVPGGSLFIVFANQLVSTTGQAGRYYYKEIGQSDIAESLLRIAKSRERLLGRGEILSALQVRFGEDCATVDTFATPSCIYGENEEDITAMCITAEIGEINDEPFDLNKLDVCARFVESHPGEIGLATETRDIPQKNMIRSNQPQIICIIRKRRNE